MKQLGFALIVAAVLVAAPAAAQSFVTPGYEFVEAVKKSDGDKALEVLSAHPNGIMSGWVDGSVRFLTNNTDLVVLKSVATRDDGIAVTIE